MSSDLKELNDALATNSFAKNNPRVVYGNAMQDAQYSPEARQAAECLAKFIPLYGQWSIKQIQDWAALREKVSSYKGNVKDVTQIK
jgi:hypothetical protein